MKKLKVTKHNALIKSSYRLSLMEIRIVLYGISLINSVTKEFPTSYIISIDKFSSIFDIKKSRLYKDIKEVVTKKFWERDFSYVDEKGYTLTYRWLSGIKYHAKKGHIEIFYNPLIQPLLNDLRNCFTTYHLERVSEMKSIYSIRVYELCIMEFNKSKNPKKVITFYINITELRKFLMLGDEYPRFSNFKARVLEVARSEINKSSDISIKYEVEKFGHSADKIIFTVKKKKDDAYYDNESVKLKAKDANEKDRRTNHKPMHSTSSNITTLGSSTKSIIENIKKHIDLA